MSEVLPRITEVINWSALGPATFADEIGVNRAVISHILSARNKASLEVVQKILNRFSEISSSWLLLGQGEMLNTLGKHSSASAQDLQSSESTIREEEALLNISNTDKVQTPSLSTSALKPEVNSPERRLVKVVLFYSDGKFEQYDPS